MSDSVFSLGDCDGAIYPELDIANYCTHEDANSSLNMASVGDLSILYINIVSLPCNMDQLVNLLTHFDKKPDLIALSETKITEICNTEYHPYLESYKYYNIKSKTMSGSVGLFVRNTLVCTTRHDLNCSENGLYEMFWVDISSHSINSAKTTVGIVYRHNKTSIPSFSTRIENIVSKLIRENTNFYILGDFNMNLIKTHDIYNILDFVNTMHSLNAVNLVNKPTRFPIGKQRGGPSILDHLWTNEPFRVKKIDMIVNPISDHRPTLFILNIRKKIVSNCSRNYFIRDMSNFDEEAFNESLFNFIPTSPNVNQSFAELQGHILKCINDHAPLRKRTKKEQKFMNKPWISESIQISIANKDKLYAYLQTHNNPLLKRKYNKQKKILKKVTFAAKCRYYEQRFEEYKNNSKKMWKMINELTCRKNRDKNTIQALKLANGQLTSDAKTIANTLNEYFVNIGTNLANQLPTAPMTYEHFLKNPQANSFFLHPTDPGEISKIMNSFSSHKAAGLIPAKFFKAGAPALCCILSNLINDSFSTGIFPQTLKLARVTPIFKEGSPYVAANYRPISIISVIAKLVEKLVYNRLIKYIEKNSIINNSQFGFRSGHSTTHAITSIHERILENINNNQHTVSIYLDLSKAFDCVNHSILIKKLHHYGIRGVALEFFKSYLSNRQQLTIVNGEVSNILSLICGVPQGSTLGPLLFLLYINDLATASNFMVSLFADDTCLLLSNENLNSLENACNEELVNINNWFLANKLTANLSKASKYMLTVGKLTTKHPDNFRLMMGNTLLEKVNKVKYLGVIFDDRFQWHDHISYICSKIARSVGVLSKLRYYVDVQTLLKVYYSLVHSHLNHALIAWGAAGVTALRHRLLKYPDSQWSKTSK